MQNAQGTGMGSPPGESAESAQSVKRQVSGVASEVKQGASDLVDGAKAQAVGAVEQRKTAAAESLGTVAEALRGAAHTLADGPTAPLREYAESAAEQVDKVARYLKEKDVQTLARDTETFARRHPEVFLGGAFLAGILAARFLKSTGQRASSDGRGGAEAGAGGPTGTGWQSWDTAPVSGGGAGYAQPFNPPHVTTTEQ